MKKIIIYGAIGLFLLMAGCSGLNSYNRFATLDEEKNMTWAHVQAQYQRRADLIPNLATAVENYANFERNTLKEVIEARAKATSITIDPSNMTPEMLRQFEATQGNLTQALSKLMVVFERYPDLKANQQFSELMAELSGTENRITIARNKFNDAVQGYNRRIRIFPGNVWAGVFSFAPAPYFEAESGAQKAFKLSKMQ